MAKRKRCPKADSVCLHRDDHTSNVLMMSRGPRGVLWYDIWRRSLCRLVGLIFDQVLWLLLTPAFRIGEISLMKDLTKTMEMSDKFEKEQEQAEKAAASEVEHKPSTTSIHDTPSEKPPPVPPRDHAAGPTTSNSEPPPAYDPAHAKDAAPEKPPRPSDTQAPPAYEHNPYSQERPAGVPTRAAIMDKSEADARDSVAGVSQAEKDLRAKEKKKGLTKEQREEMLKYEEERARVRKERVNALAEKLINRMSVWTETDKDKAQTAAFKEKTKLEVENLKMESFGIEILHAIGHTYLMKGTNHLKSQNLFGIGGFFGRMKEKGSMVKDVWGTISSAMDAQESMAEMAKAEEKGGDSWTDEARADLERRVTGKILAAAWRGSKFEIQGVLRDVCDKVLEDRRVHKDKRNERAQALILMGGLMKDAHRTEDEENEYMVFEQLMAEAAKKKEKKADEQKKHSAAEKAGEGKHFPFRSKEKSPAGAAGDHKEKV